MNREAHNTQFTTLKIKHTNSFAVLEVGQCKCVVEEGLISFGY